MKYVVVAGYGRLLGSNGYELIGVVLMVVILFAILLAPPGHSHTSLVLKLLAIIIAFASKFISNSNLSNQPGSPINQADEKNYPWRWMEWRISLPQ